MRAVLCKSLDGPDSLVLDEVPEPIADADQIVIRVKAAALNFFDTLITRGTYQTKPALPFSPSGEIAGVVEHVGSAVTGFETGQRVMAYLGYGGARDKVAVRPSHVVALPDGISFEVGSGLAITYGTAIHGLRQRALLAAGETVAVIGAAGGAGLAAVEIAKLMGARVIAAASSDEKLALCRAHGADETIDTAVQDRVAFKDRLKALTGGTGVDVVYDCVGGWLCESAVRALAWQGRYLVVGFAGGDIPKLPLNLLLLKGAAAVGVFWGEAQRRDPAGFRTDMAFVLQAIADGRLKPHIHGVFVLADIHEALAVIEGRQAQGKVVLTLDGAATRRL